MLKRPEDARAPLPNAQIDPRLAGGPNTDHLDTESPETEADHSVDSPE